MKIKGLSNRIRALMVKCIVPNFQKSNKDEFIKQVNSPEIVGILKVYRSILHKTFCKYSQAEKEIAKQVYS
jgi:hypothetical protein